MMCEPNPFRRFRCGETGDTAARTGGRSDKRLAVVAAEISNGSVVRLQMPQQPDHLDVAMGLSFEATAGSHTVQVAVDVKLQQIGGS